MSRKRVLLVCMVDSIHVARWISQFDPEEFEFTLFPSTPNRRVHSMIKEMMANNQNISLVPFGGHLSIPLWGVDLIFSDYVRGLILRKVIKILNPDFVHALELQHGGYIASRALEDLSIKNLFIATNYGSDIFWFQQFPKHLAKIKKLLARADRYSAECQRDIELAKKYGFSGEMMPVVPNAGGFTNEQLDRKLTPTSERKVIAIKGYDGWVGRASIAVEALYYLEEELADYRVVFYSCNLKTIRLVRRLNRRTSLNVDWHAKGKLSHNQMLELFSSARIYIGVSLSDGLSTSMIEAATFRAFPIQSNSSCAQEWVGTGPSSVLMDTLDPIALAHELRRVLNDTELLDSAGFTNLASIKKNFSEKILLAHSRRFYEI